MNDINSDKIIYTSDERNCLNTFCIDSEYTKLNSSKLSKIYLVANHDKLEYVLNFMKTYCNFFSEKTTLSEMIYCIKNHIQIQPVCEICGKPVKFRNFKFGYNSACCQSHALLTKHARKKYNESVLKNPNRYKNIAANNFDYKNINNIVDSYILKQFVKHKISGSAIIDGNKINENTKWCKKHTKVVQYIKNRYTDSNNIEENVHRLFHKINKKPVCKTCGAPVRFISFRLGYANFCSHSCKTKNPEVRAKLINTNRKKYGCDCVFNNKEIKQKCINTYTKHLQDINYKFNFSIERLNASERKIYDILINDLNYNVKIFYKDIRYKNLKNNHLWECDFYIPELDLFIEYNGFPTHGDHPYDKNNLDDVNKRKWLNKQKQLTNIKAGKPKNANNYYKDCISVWCNLDVLKRKVANDNKLLYVTLYEKTKENITKEYIQNEINKIIKEKA